MALKYYAIIQKVKSLKDGETIAEEIIYTNKGESEPKFLIGQYISGKIIPENSHFIKDALSQLPNYTLVRITEELDFEFSHINEPENIDLISKYRELSAQGKNIIKSLINNFAAIESRYKAD